jgi:Restriction endonuclease
LSYTTSKLIGKVGEKVEYSIVVKSTGNVSLKLAKLTDPKCENISPNEEKTVAVGGEQAYTCDHVLTRTDINNPYINTAIAKAEGPAGEKVEHESNKAEAEAKEEKLATPGGYYNDNGTLFYVSPNGAQVQDVALNVKLGCSVGGEISSHIAIGTIAIESEGSFTATETETGIYSAGRPIKITSTFTGQFDGAKAAGTYREEVAFEDGSKETCTTNTQAWSVTLEAEGSQALAPPKPGGYSNDNGTLFSVSSDSSEVQTVALASVKLSCSTGSEISSHIAITEVPIESETTFSGAAEESGEISGRKWRSSPASRGTFMASTAPGTSAPPEPTARKSCMKKARPARRTPSTGRQRRSEDDAGVSAVRDLFGTMQNEGATKGILVTTSGYGQASHDFANGKPLELIDGGNLLYLLEEHAGIVAKIEVCPRQTWSGSPRQAAPLGAPRPSS